MITFLPWNSYRECAKSLDNARLRNQVFEAKIIYETIVRESGCREFGKNSGVNSAPMFHMWRGWAPSLLRYTSEMIEECEARRLWIDPIWRSFVYLHIENAELPPFMGDERLHKSHRKALVFKKPEWYLPQFKMKGEEHQYFFPVRQKDWVLWFADEFYKEQYLKVDWFVGKPYQVGTLPPLPQQS